MEAREKWKLRKRAQREIPLEPGACCESCGSTSGLQRHHYAGLQNWSAVKIICQACHTREDHKNGQWGHGPKRDRVCVVCQRVFKHGHSKAKTCSRACLSVRGRQNASLRWHRAETDSAAWEMPLFRRSPRSPGEH